MRRHLTSLKDLEERTLLCGCGREIVVLEKDITNVQCYFCITKTLSYNNLSLANQIKFDQAEIKHEKKELADKEKRRQEFWAARKNHSPEKSTEEINVDLPTEKPKRKRKSKMTNQEPIIGQSLTALVIDETSVIPTQTTNKSNDEQKAPKQRKPRKLSSIKEAVINLLQNQSPSEGTDFDSILQVYMAEREKAGKHSHDEKKEKINCTSFLFNLIRTGVIIQDDETRRYFILSV